MTGGLGRFGCCDVLGPPDTGHRGSRRGFEGLDNALRAWSLAERRALLFKRVGPPVTEHDPSEGALSESDRIGVERSPQMVPGDARSRLIRAAAPSVRETPGTAQRTRWLTGALGAAQTARRPLASRCFSWPQAEQVRTQPGWSTKTCFFSQHEHQARSQLLTTDDIKTSRGEQFASSVHPATAIGGPRVALRVVSADRCRAFPGSAGCVVDPYLRLPNSVCARLTRCHR